MDRARIEKISKALADATRLQIFESISANGEIICGELVALRGVTPATVSHHLKILAISGAFGSDSLLIRVSLPVFVLQTAKVPRVSFHILAAPRPYALDQLPRLAPPP